MRDMTKAYLKIFLPKKGIPEVEVDTAIDGEEALNMLSKRKYDLLVTDRNMPGMNGLELATHTRSKFPDLPIILYSAEADMTEDTRENSVFAKVVMKGNPTDLVDAVSHYLKSS